MLKKIVILLFVTCFACFNTVFAAESGGMPQLNPEFWISQIFWLIITFGILFIVLTKVILPKISDNLETRKSQILENIETADKQKDLLTKLKVELAFSKFEIFSLTQSQPSLDDVYLQATGKTLLDAEISMAGKRDLKKESKQSMR